MEAVHASYTAKLATVTVFDDDTRAAYASRVRQYLAWLAHTNIDGDPLTDKAAPTARSATTGPTCRPCSNEPRRPSTRSSPR